MQPKTTTRRQRLDRLLARPQPSCASAEWKYEYYKIVWMLRDILDGGAKDVRQIWLTELLSEALTTLHDLTNPTEPSSHALGEDTRRWTDVIVRRIIAEGLGEEDGSVTFYDCVEVLRTGRSKAAAMRSYEQARICWERITDTDLRTEFSLHM